MKKTNVVKLLTYLSSAYPAKMKFPLSGQEETKLMLEVWYDFLEEYDDNLVLIAAKKLIVNSPDWPPTIGNVVKEVEDIIRPAEEKISGAEAWKLVLRAVRVYGYYRSEEAMKSLPEKVQEAVKNFGGFASICHSEANSTFVRKQFIDIYINIDKRYKENNYLPEPIRKRLKLLEKNSDDNLIE